MCFHKCIHLCNHHGNQGRKHLSPESVPLPIPFQPPSQEATDRLSMPRDKSVNSEVPLTWELLCLGSLLLGVMCLRFVLVFACVRSPILFFKSNFVEASLKYQVTHPFQVHNSMISSEFTKLCAQHWKSVLECFFAP